MSLSCIFFCNETCVEIEVLNHIFLEVIILINWL